MMQIHVRLYGPLRDRFPSEAKGKATLEFAEGATVQEIFNRLELPPTLLVAINDDHETEPSTLLQDGVQVAFFTPVSGG
ncbi:MAG: MoaD/ThiS family protein [Chloroflexota bacterium]